MYRKKEGNVKWELWRNKNVTYDESVS